MPAVFSSLKSFTVAALLLCIVVIATTTTILSFVSAMPVSRNNNNKKMVNGRKFLPPVIDWRTKGVVGPTQNQGQSGDAALFATLGNIASVSAIVNGMKYVPLSVQELETCGPNSNNGGFLDAYYRWIAKDAKGFVAKEVSGTNITCSDLSSLPVGAKISAVRGIISSEAEIHQALESGPVFVGIDADDLETYSGGVVTQCGGKTIDDAALIVGINMTATPPRWIVQMSWGENWGMKGFVEIEYGKNLCGINSYPMTVTADKI